MSAGLGREDIRVLLDELSQELAARGAKAELFLVGGAALAVAYRFAGVEALAGEPTDVDHTVMMRGRRRLPLRLLAG
jgi:hypothetical protein